MGQERAHSRVADDSLIGSAQNGSTRWVVDAVKARGIDLLHNVREHTTQGSQSC